MRNEILNLVGAEAEKVSMKPKVGTIQFRKKMNVHIVPICAKETKVKTSIVGPLPYIGLF